MSESNDIIDEAVLIETIENQLQDGEPKQVKETLMRLMMTGTPREDALALMACALSVEVFDVMKNGVEFNQKRYANHLSQLPDLGFMEGE
ncbi:hypothetical protein MACH09_17380 [Vibrio sp. MACH09]|uniref:hypothetical protein n=1 Tax=unclassified Vibrio TaxID=2614977 RepID=UPI001493558A|nr:MULTISPECIES: hypothetical protein [unclassified Vibrio]NOI68069.1 hypothetical protein [Vibrio sp. 99-8-1]GLO61230.1 hypothetical protein MACH09_17380 [Vibrio sp. MACH09]